MSLNPGASFPGKGQLSFCWICSWEDVKLGATSKRSDRQGSGAHAARPERVIYENQRI